MLLIFAICFATTTLLILNNGQNKMEMRETTRDGGEVTERHFKVYLFLSLNTPTHAQYVYR